MDKKFNINGREKEYYYLTNKELVSLIEEENTTKEDKEFLTQKLIGRFKYECCPHSEEEDSHNVFARQFGDFVNGQCFDKRKTALIMSRNHRYLVQEMFMVCLEFIEILASNYKDNLYDGRNEWSVKTSNKIVEFLKKKSFN